MTQNNLLGVYGLDDLIKSKKVKLIRHKDSSLDFKKILSHNLLEEYQSFQSKDIFKGCDYILSYIAFGKTHSLFYGIYEVINSRYKDNIFVSKELAETGHSQNFSGYVYELKEVDFLNDLKERLVIDWGKSTITWHQWLDHKKDKEVIEIRPSGYVADFPGYLDIVLSFAELKKIVNNKEANQKWFDKLSSIYAIYLILDTKTGNQYIGSASGKNGLWGRWEEYTKTIHGGNKGLIELIKNNDEEYKYHLQYSILHVLSATKGSQVGDYETLYKEKLGSKVFGLNEN